MRKLPSGLYFTRPVNYRIKNPQKIKNKMEIRTLEDMLLYLSQTNEKTIQPIYTPKDLENRMKEIYITKGFIKVTGHQQIFDISVYIIQDVDPFVYEVLRFGSKKMYHQFIYSDFMLGYNKQTRDFLFKQGANKKEISKWALLL